MIEKNRVSEQTILQIAEPEWTDTWHPISHARCLNVLDSAIQEMELPVQRKEYSSSNDGTKVYGTIVIGNGDELSKTIIWRNSINKFFSFGMCAGTHAWACSNLMMSGDFVQFRRHTKGMDDNELRRIVLDGMEVIIPHSERLVEWHAALHTIKFDMRRAKHLAYDAIVEEVVPRPAIPEFHNLLFGENPEYDYRELFGIHGAATQIHKEGKLTGSFADRQQNLLNFINERYGEKLPELLKVA